MRALARLVLSLGVVGLPWTIACAYGMPASYSRTGKVVDADTHVGIAGALVRCMKAGVDEGDGTSLADGTVTVDYGLAANACETLDASDPAGKYLSASVPFDSASTTFTLLLKAR